MKNIVEQVLITQIVLYTACLWQTYWILKHSQFYRHQAPSIYHHSCSLQCHRTSYVVLKKEEEGEEEVPAIYNDLIGSWEEKDASECAIFPVSFLKRKVKRRLKVNLEKRRKDKKVTLKTCFCIPVPSFMESSFLQDYKHSENMTQEKCWTSSWLPASPKWDQGLSAPLTKRIHYQLRSSLTLRTQKWNPFCSIRSYSERSFEVVDREVKWKTCPAAAHFTVILDLLETILPLGLTVFFLSDENVENSSFLM